MYLFPTEQIVDTESEMAPIGVISDKSAQLDMGAERPRMIDSVLRAYLSDSDRIAEVELTVFSDSLARDKSELKHSKVVMLSDRTNGQMVRFGYEFL